jgi:hypothetical protein
MKISPSAPPCYSPRTKDRVATAAAIVIIWPAASSVVGDKQTAAELSLMKVQSRGRAGFHPEKSEVSNLKVRLLA